MADFTIYSTLKLIRSEFLLEHFRLRRWRVCGGVVKVNAVSEDKRESLLLVLRLFRTPAAKVDSLFHVDLGVLCLRD